MLLPARRVARLGFLTLAVLVPTTVGLAAEAADAKRSRGGAVRATAFRSCDGFVGYARRQAMNSVESQRLTSPVPLALGAPAPSVPTSGGPEVNARAAPMSQPGVDHSPTNVQEAGVDEPDIVKTDGSRIFAVTDDELHAVDATGRTPRLVGSLPLKGATHDLLLRGDRLLVISRWYGYVQPLLGVQIQRRGARGASYRSGGEQTLLAEVDVRNPAAMRIVRTLRIDGRYVNSRMNGGTARVVVGSHPRTLDPLPNPGPVPESADQARERLMRAGVARWLPSYLLRNRRTGRTAEHRLVRCRAVRHASSFSGLDLLTVLTIDLDKGLQPVDSDALLTDADTVYASSRSLYVTSERWLDPALTEHGAPETTTAIHKFDITEPGRTFYRASGEVPGFLLNQFSLSEHRGFLRVASTEQPSWWAGAPSRQSESFVTVLDERDRKLVQVGRVGGLGHGERIYSVRFIDDVGFVVTFRQTDPLYTIDLSTPQRPSVLGELKILGYSAYLHPIGNDLLIGVGQDATEAGRRLGTQVSLFDVSDLRRPVRLDSRTVARGASSEVEYDHHAFLYWPAAKLAVMPLQIYGGDPTWRNEFAGAIGFRIGRGSGIDEVGRVRHDEVSPGPDRFGTPVRRALVVGSRLFTVSARGIEASSLETLAELAWVPFG